MALFTQTSCRVLSDSDYGAYARDNDGSYSTLVEPNDTGGTNQALDVAALAVVAPLRRRAAPDNLVVS
jgi:hypothetical protein